MSASSDSESGRESELLNRTDYQVRDITRRLQLALSAGQLGDWSWDAKSDQLTFGEHGARIFGFQAGAPVTWEALRELLHPDDRDRARVAVEEALRTRTDYDIEYRVFNKDKTIAWVAAKGTGVYAPDGTVEGMIGLVQDVTDRRLAEESRFRLAAIVESSDDAIVSKSLDGIIISWNAGAERMFGYRADEIVGRSVLMLIPKLRQSEERQILDTLLRGERIEHYETMRLRKNGTEFAVSLTVSPVRDDAGNIVGASKIARDISARRAVEQKLWDESQTLNLLNDTGRALAGQLSHVEIVQRATDAATTLSGARFGAFFDASTDKPGTWELQVLSGLERAAFEALGDLRGLPLLAPTWRGEAGVRCDDVARDRCFEGQSQDHALRSCLSVPVKSQSGEVLGALVFGHAEPGVFTQRSEDLVSGVAAQAAIAIDNARLYQRLHGAAEERQFLLEAERAARMESERVSVMKDEFLATLSHELRTPLNAILGWAQVLETGKRSEEDLQNGLRVISRNARMQAQLIEDLLDMSRIIAGKIRLDLQRIDPREVVTAAMESVRHSAEAKQIRVRLAFDPRGGEVWADAVRLQQCVWNLLSNAIKFTPNGGSIEVHVARVQDRIRIRVVDSGQGIEGDVLPHVFERFRQADSSTTRRFGGLGLGLSIVKSITELHAGSVHAHSLGAGQGSTFTLELPLAGAAPAGASGESRGKTQRAHADLPDLAGITVVVIDDDRDARLLVKRILDQCGAHVFVAGSAAEGLELVRRERPRLLISDIGMPEEDGYELIRKVRQLGAEQGGKIPAIALSAFARAEDRTRALRAGYQVHIAKPVDPAELTALVASLIGSY